jgi:hypothetical protein
MDFFSRQRAEVGIDAHDSGDSFQRPAIHGAMGPGRVATADSLAAT